MTAPQALQVQKRAGVGMHRHRRGSWQFLGTRFGEANSRVSLRGGLCGRFLLVLDIVAGAGLFETMMFSPTLPIAEERNNCLTYFAYRC